MNWHLTHFAVRPVLSLGVRQDWWDAAFEILKRDGADAWHVAMYGA